MAAEQFVKCLGVNVKRRVFADLVLDDGENIRSDVLGFLPVLFIPFLQLAHVACGLDLDVQLDVLREAGEGEVARSDQGNRAYDCDARVGDVGFGVELLFRVGAAFDFSVAQGLDDGGKAAEKIIFLLLGFDAVVEARGDFLFERVEDGLASAGGNLTAHEDANFVELLPLAVESEKRADLKVAGGDVKRAGDLGPVLEVLKSLPRLITVVNDEELAACSSWFLRVAR